MEKLWNYLRGLFDVVGEMQRLRSDVSRLQESDHRRDLGEQAMIARLREIVQLLEHKDQLQKAEARALKAELEAELLRLERRLKPPKEDQ